MPTVHDTFIDDRVVIHQYLYPRVLYQSEIAQHTNVVNEYGVDISDAMHSSLMMATPDTRLLSRQPYLTPAGRFKLVEFALKILIRLKTLPYVFCRAVKLFDRYCLKRIVLPEQFQLIMATCVWIAAKVHGGNCHYSNSNNDHCSEVKGNAILDLGFGSGSRSHGPTQRYRPPRVKELIRLCGARCNYTPRMFIRMELYVMTSLDWNITDPGIDDFLISLDELNTIRNVNDTHVRPLDHDFRRMKQFLAYAVAFLFEAAEFDAFQIARVSLDIINETYHISRSNPRYQGSAPRMAIAECDLEYTSYTALRIFMTAAVATAPMCLLDYFSDTGPNQLHMLLTCATYSLQVDMSTRPSLLPQLYSPPSSMNTPKSARVCDSPITPIESICESEAYMAMSVRKTVAGLSGHSDPEEMYQRTRRRNNIVGLLTPTLNAPTMNSHQYPALLPSTCSVYMRGSDGLHSIRSNNSVYENEVFDHQRPRLGSTLLQPTSLGTRPTSRK